MEKNYRSILLLKLAQIKLFLAGFGRHFLLFWSSILLGSRPSNLASLKNLRDHSPLLTILSIVSLLWILFLHSLWLTWISLHIYSLTIKKRLLGSMQVPGWSLMSYPQFLLNLLGRSPLNLSGLMASLTCFVFGVYEELVPYFPGMGFSSYW